MKEGSKPAGAQRACGFTILEVLIVFVILSVCAGLSLPIFSKQIERTNAQEAIQHLDAVSDAMKVYRGFNGSYARPSPPGGFVTFTQISYNPNTPIGGQVPRFSYVLSVTSSTAFTCTAQRLPAVGNMGNTVVLTQNDLAALPVDRTVITRQGVYK